MKLLIFVLLVIFTGCSVFQSTEKSKEETVSEDQVEEVYVFDEVPADSDAKEEEIRQLEEELDKTSGNKKTEVDVFDEPINEPATQQQVDQATSFYLQLGAFSSLKRAEDYSREIESQVPFKLSVIYNSQTSYYNVRSKAFSTRDEVEAIRDDFWSKNLFKDAFIITE